jgi:hypothetical protein
MGLLYGNVGNVRRLVMKTQVELEGQGVRDLSRNGSRCIWMKAGVVNFKTCENDFDCTSCAFDKAIGKESAQTPTALGGWKEVMRNPNLQKECRHMLTGRVLFKLCSHNYECQDCAYDQLLADYDELLGGEDLPVRPAAQVDKIAGFMIADGYCRHGMSAACDL